MQMKKESGRSQPEILKDIIYGIGQAIGASSQLIHASGNPAFWMMTREALELMNEGCLQMAPKNLVYAEPPKKIIV